MRLWGKQMEGSSLKMFVCQIEKGWSCHTLVNVTQATITWEGD